MPSAHQFKKLMPTSSEFRSRVGLNFRLKNWPLFSVEGLALIKLIKPLADLGGAASAPPPTGFNSFIFAYIFAEKYPRRRLVPPSNGLATPPNGKSWIRHCKLYY